MQKKLFYIALFVLSSLSTSMHYPTDKEWKLWKEKEGIRVYTRYSESSNYKELKMETEFKGTLNSFVAVLQDLHSYPSWVYASQNSKLLKQISPQEIIYYTQADFPWPLQDRDFVLHNRVWQDPKTLTLYSKTANHNKYPHKQEEGVVRVKHLEATWKFTPLKNQVIHLEYTLKSDPGGTIPAWLVNMALDIGPLKTLKSLNTLVKEPRYAQAKFPFIKEPAQ